MNTGLLERNKVKFAPEKNLSQVEVEQEIFIEDNYDWVNNISFEQMVENTKKSVALGKKRLPPIAIAVANRIYNRTLTGNKFTESTLTAAKEMGVDRKFVAKGLNILINLNIISREKRPGETDEYWFNPIEEWQTYVPPVRERVIRIQKNLELPNEQEKISGITEPVLEEDTNCTVVNLNNLNT